MKIYYSDVCQVIMREYDGKIILGVHDPEYAGTDQIEKIAAVYMNLAQMKILSEILSNSVAKHEKAHGEIKVPDKYNYHKTMQ